MKTQNNIIYLHRNIINGKVYVGQTNMSLELRSRFDGSGYKGCSHFWNAIQKYGWDNFEHTILESNLSDQEADEREKFWINFFHSTDSKYGYNIMVGGKTNRKKIDTKKKIYCKETGQFFNSLSEAAEWAGLARTSMHDLTLNAQGKRYCAGKHPQTGEKLHWCFTESELKKENKERIIHNIQKIINLDTLVIYESIAKASLETGISENTLIKCCKSQGARPCSKESKLSYWAYLKDYENHNINSKEQPKSKAIKKAVKNINTGKIFKSLTEAAQWCNLANVSRITISCQDNTKSAGKHPQTGEKLYWEFFN